MIIQSIWVFLINGIHNLSIQMYLRDVYIHVHKLTQYKCKYRRIIH